MLWRAHFLRTSKSTVNLKKEVNLQPKCDTFTATKRNLHYQSHILQRLGSANVHSFININNRYASTKTLDFINCIPKTLFEFTTDKLAALPSFEELTQSLTIEHFMPVKIFQSGLLYLHDCCCLPWWGAITIGAIAVRLLLLPLAVLAERNDARIANSLPQLQFLQSQLAAANKTGDDFKSERLTQEIFLFKNYKNLSLRNSFVVTLVQAPLFVLFLATLRSMTNAPLKSISEGGLLWFTDLTAADPIYVLPIVTSATLCVIIELALRNANILADDKAVIHTLRACPLVILPYTINFSAALLFYWACNNLITLAQASVFQIPAVRRIFKIEKTIHYLPNASANYGKALFKKDTEPMLNEMISQELKTKQRLDKMRFSKVRKDPLGRHSSTIQIENVPPIPQRLKLKAIMEATNIKF